MSNPSAPSKTAQELEQMKKWVQTWREAGPVLGRIRREELRKLDPYKAISNFLGPIDFSQEPFRPKPTSGLVIQQALFKKLRQ